MLGLRGEGTVKVSKVKGHADQAMVGNGGDARNEDRIGNNGADAAADLGRLRQQDDVITSRRALIRVRSHWYPVMLDLHKFMVAISRILVIHGGHGSTAPHPMTWDHGSSIKPRASSLWVTVDFASLPVFWTAPGAARSIPLSLKRMLLSGPAALPFFLSLLRFWPRFTGLRVLIVQENLVFFLELLVMFELHTGRMLTCEKVIRPHLRACGPLVGSSSPASIGKEIRRGCQFIHRLFRSLGHLPGGLVRFVPGQPSAHFTRLLHLGWGQCGHGLSSGPRESCDMHVLHLLLMFFGCPDGAATELCNGTLKLRFSQPLSLTCCPLGLLLVTPVALQWLVPAQVSSFIFLIMTLLNSALRSASGSLARVLLKSFLLRLLGNLQRLSGGEG